MNKRIFTLLASSLMLFLAVTVVNAQTRTFYGPDVPFLPTGMGKGAYLLKVTSIGSTYNASSAGWDDLTLALDEKGYLKLVNETYILNTYRHLREALWCVNVVKPEKLGQQPVYNFLNKAYETYLAVDTGRWDSRYGEDYGLSIFNNPAYTPVTDYRHWIWPQWSVSTNLERTRAFARGQFGDWAFSHVYEHNLLKNEPLLIEIPDEPDYFMTFATKLNEMQGSPWVGIAHDTVQLVKVHKNDLNSGAAFKEYSLIHFTLASAGARVLTEDDFNTTLWTNPSGTSSKMLFDPNTNGQPNVFAQELRAYESVNNGTTSTSGWNEDYYLNFRKPASNDRGDLIYVVDSTDINHYYNDTNIHYPKILETPNKADALIDGRYDFRLVYYPSEDSLVMNVREIVQIDPIYGNYANFASYPGHALDLKNYNLGDNFLFNREIWDWLTVRMQDLTTTLNERVITIYNRPAKTRINFGINNCIATDDRTSVPRNLYLIRDSIGRYLVMPLELGDFTPKWLEPRNNEDPMKTPSYHWLIAPQIDSTKSSSVTLTNREFDWVQIEFSQIYNSYNLFDGYFRPFLISSSTGLPTTPVDYNNIFGINSGAKVYYSSAVTDRPTLKNGGAGHAWNVADGWHGSFLIVQDDQAAAAKVAAKAPLSQDEMQVLHRTSPYLGYKYIAEDTLGFFTYSFNHLHAYSNEYYLGPKQGQFTDTLLYGIQSQNHFELILPDSRQDKHGMEKYGIGWADNHLKHAATRDIAPLQRYYYHFKENNYWDFTFADNFVVLGENTRYGFTTQEVANTRAFEKSAFYLRFTYQPEGKPEYYSLLERVKKSSMKAMVNFIGLQFSQELKIYDESHGGSIENDTVGILVLSLEGSPAYARAQAKVTGNVVSTFAISNATEPLYRRFNEGVYIPSGLDAKVNDGGERANDDPRLAKIYRANNVAHTDYLYEDAHSVNARDYYTPDGRAINYLSLENIFDHNAAMAQDLGHYPHNFSFYLDTAYVNRGTGHIKPQYLIVVGPEKINENGCYLCGEPLNLRKGLYGRFLINATDSARGAGWGPGNTGFYRDQDYIWDTSWERLVFVPGVHIGDSLYILRGGLDIKALRAMKIFRADEFGEEYLHLPTLIAEGKKANSLIDIHPLDNNYHKDYVFSMRFYERGDYERFLLESETTNRNRSMGRMIAPMRGGWVKWQNHEMVISRGSYVDAIRDGEKWNTEPTTDAPVANDEIDATIVKVIAGEGNVTILNAAGKRVTISNILGQTVASAILTSDNATISAPKGIQVVVVEGENAVKAVVK